MFYVKPRVHVLDSSGMLRTGYPGDRRKDAILGKCPCARMLRVVPRVCLMGTGQYRFLKVPLPYAVGGGWDSRGSRKSHYRAESDGKRVPKQLVACRRKEVSGIWANPEHL